MIESCYYKKLIRLQSDQRLTDVVLSSGHYMQGLHTMVMEKSRVYPKRLRLMNMTKPLPSAQRPLSRPVMQSVGPPHLTLRSLVLPQVVNRNMASLAACFLLGDRCSVLTGKSYNAMCAAKSAAMGLAMTGLSSSIGESGGETETTSSLVGLRTIFGRTRPSTRLRPLWAFLPLFLISSSSFIASLSSKALLAAAMLARRAAGSSDIEALLEARLRKLKFLSKESDVRPPMSLDKTLERRRDMDCLTDFMEMLEVDMLLSFMIDPRRLETDADLVIGPDGPEIEVIDMDLPCRGPSRSIMSSSSAAVAALARDIFRARTPGGVYGLGT